MESLLKASKYCSVGKLVIRFEVKTEKCFFTWCKLHCCSCVLGMPEDQWVQGAASKPEEDECRGQDKLGSVVAPSSAARS